MVLKRLKLRLYIIICLCCFYTLVTQKWFKFPMTALIVGKLNITIFLISTYSFKKIVIKY